MASQWLDDRDIKFLLHEVLNIGEELLGKGLFEDHDPDMVNLVLSE
ncbi:MAG: acyl-CoA dehydrogenase N-terminal domain-containing protein, partial [Deltaproteobacteria bacterium]|nr:acyl-CoA dehydrogenase N-terminal domain-containing protein [Deltaproteobacteria bacterium]